MRLQAPRRRVIGGLAGLLFLAGSCGQSERRPTGTVRDSAGVRIVDNVEAAWSETTRWRLTDRPLLDIGVLEGDPAFELFDAQAAVALADGRVVVANGGTREIRFFDAGGGHLRTAGGDGGGPGEFRRLSWLARLPGDSLAVYDQTQRRITIFDGAGDYVRDIPLARRDRLFFPILLGRFRDGSYAGHLVVRGAREDLPVGMGRDSVYELRFDRHGALVDTIGVFPNRIIDVQMRSIGSNRMRLPATLPFTPRTVVAAGPDRLVVGTTDAYAVQVFDPNGRMVSAIRKSHAPIRVTEDDRRYVVDSLRTRYAGRLSNPEIDYMIRTTSESPLPDAFPAYDSLLADADGNLWVREYRRPGDARTRWSVFDGDGVYLGVVHGPDRFRATDLGTDYVLGVWTDDLAVEHVLKFGLLKPPS